MSTSLDALVVFTGVSGSGKSSVAFSTLYAEAQRRYLESVSPYRGNQRDRDEYGRFTSGDDRGRSSRDYDDDRRGGNGGRGRGGWFGDS